MQADNLAQLQAKSVTIFGDILDQAREYARLYGATSARPSHLLRAILAHRDAHSLLADDGIEPLAVQSALARLLQDRAEPPIAEKPLFDEPLDAALFSTQILLETAPAEIFKESCERLVLKQLLDVIDRHAGRDPICNEALACVTLQCLEVERISSSDDELDAFLDTLDDSIDGLCQPQEDTGNRYQSRLYPGAFRAPSDPKQEAAAEADGAGPSGAEVEQRDVAPRPEQAAKSQLARDAVEVEAAVNRAFRSLSREVAEGRIDPVIGREAEIERVLSALQRRRKRSVILHGPAGVGKTAIAEGIASALRAAGAPGSLTERTVYELSLSSLVSGTRYRGDFEERMTKAIDRIVKEGAIVFIDEIHTVMGLGAAQSKGMDAPNMLKPALARGNLMLIGATTTEELAAIRQDRAIMRRFELIEVREPDISEMEQILDRAAWTYLDHHGVQPGDGLFEKILSICSEKMPAQCFPDKAFDLLDRACVEAIQGASSIVEPQHAIAAAERAGVLFPSRPSDASLRRFRQTLKRLSSLGLPAAALEAMKPGLTLSLLAPAALRGSQAWLVAGEEADAETAISALSAALERRVTRFPRTRLSEAGAYEWLVGSNHNLSGQDGALIEALETGGSDLFVFESVDQSSKAVIDLLEQMVAQGEIRTGSGRIISTRGVKMVLTSSQEQGRSIGFGARHDFEIPRALRGLAENSGVHLVALGESSAKQDEVTRLLDDLTGYLKSAGYMVRVEEGLVELLQAGASGWAGRAGQVRDAVLSQLLGDIARSPRHLSWTLASSPGEGHQVGGMPQLRLIVAAP